MNIALIGYRGTGKSHVGRLLADRLGLEYVSLDAAIVARAGMPIPKIVEQHGWADFRDRESFEVRQLAARDGLVIDTGGGVVERAENVDLLRGLAQIIWLQASVAAIVSRIGGDDNRPALTAGKTFTEEVAEVLARRNPLYTATADFAIDTERLSPEEVAERVVGFLQKNYSNS